MKRFHREKWHNVATAPAAIKRFFDKTYEEATKRIEGEVEIRFYPALSKDDAHYVVTKVKGDFKDLQIGFLERFVDALTWQHMPGKNRPLMREDLIQFEKSVTGNTVWISCAYYYGDASPPGEHKML